MTAPTKNRPAVDDDGRSPAIEAWLDGHGVAWSYDPALELARIDDAASLRNQARLGEPLDAEVVDRYAADMARGDTFPALVVRRTSKRATKVVVLGGNHRHHALRKNRTKAHPAYVVECDAEQAILLALDDNRRHGLPPTGEERRAHAVHLVALGWTRAAAAQFVGLSESAVTSAVAAKDAGTRAEQLGVATRWATLPHGHKVRLSQVRADAPFAELVKLAADATLTQAQLGEVVTTVNAARSESAALEAIGEAAAAHAERTKRAAFGQRQARGASPYARAKGVLMAAGGIDVDAVVASVPNRDVRDTMRAQIKDVAKHLMALDKALGASRSW